MSSNSEPNPKHDPSTSTESSVASDSSATPESSAASESSSSESSASELSESSESPRSSESSESSGSSESPRSAGSPGSSPLLEYRVSPDAAGQRFDKYVRRLLPEVPASAIYKLIRTRKIRLNGARAAEGVLVSEGDLVSIRQAALKATQQPRTREQSFAQTKREFGILHQDTHLLVVSKPSGLAIHPGTGIVGATLVDQARAYLGESAEGEFRPAPAHRLDRETSGVVVVAKTRQAIVRLSEMFSDDEVKKTYLVLVKGKLARQGVIDTPLAEHQQSAANKAQRGVNLQHALTRWRLLGQTQDASLLDVEIETGRTHQIRRHFADIGHPLVGDTRYGDFSFNRRARSEWGLRRMFLHAARLGFRHPVFEQEMTFRAPTPKDLAKVCDHLGIALPPKFRRED